MVGICDVGVRVRDRFNVYETRVTCSENNRVIKVHSGLIYDSSRYFNGLANTYEFLGH